VKGKGDGARIIPYIPSPATCSRIRTEMGALSQLQVGEYIIEKGGSAGHFAIHSDGATSDGTEMSAFVLGQRSADATGASRTHNQMLELKPSNDKTSETRAGDFREAVSKTAELCEKAGIAQAELMADLQPSAAMSDWAAPERLAARIMLLGTDFDGPTCGEHGALVNPMHAGTKAMDALMHGWMGKTAEDIQLDSTKAMKALFMAVGWNASPAGALIHAMSKYFALHSDKGYSVGQKYVGCVEHTKKRLLGGDGAEAAALLDSLELIGRADDLLSIKGSRAYVLAMNAPVVDRLLQPVEGSFLRFIEENKTLAKGKAPSRIADQIIAGAHSPEIIACVRAEAIIGDFYLWPMLRAIKHRLPDGSDRHILDIGPVYQEAYENLNYYARHPRLVVSGEATLLPSFAYAYVEHRPGMKSKGKRACADLERSYAAAGNNDKTIALITAALEKIASLHSHTSELQRGGRFAGENVTPELRARYSGVNVTNTPVERAFGLEKFLHTRERSSQLHGRRGWVLFKYKLARTFGAGS